LDKSPFVLVSLAKETFAKGTSCFSEPDDGCQGRDWRVALFLIYTRESLYSSSTHHTHSFSCVLQRVAVCCSVLWQTILCCRVLPCVAVCCRVLPCVYVLAAYVLKPLSHLSLSHMSLPHMSLLLPQMSLLVLPFLSASVYLESQWTAMCCGVLQCVVAVVCVPLQPPSLSV